MLLNIFCDGGARGNPGPAAIGFLITDKTGKSLHKTHQFIGKNTNNAAEYTAVITALDWLQKNWSKIKPPPTGVNFFLDSKLTVNQLNGLYKIKNSNLRELIVKIRQLENQIKAPLKYNFIRREQNKKADALVNLALDRALH